MTGKLSKRLRVLVLGLIAAVAVAAAAVAVPALTSNSAESEQSAEKGEQAERGGEAEREREGEGREGEEEGESEEDEAAGPEDSWLFKRVAADLTPKLTVPLATFERAGRQAAAVRADTSREAPSMRSPAWQFEGPSNIGGRIVDLALDPKQSDTVYVLAATGGVWKTTDAGATFEPVWPNSYPQSMGAIAVAPDGTIYVGTGETNPGGGSITYGGSGVYRSTDGGHSWKHMGLSDSATIGRIVIDPKDPNRIYVAASGNLFNPGGERGLYVSDDRGQTWKRAFDPPNDTTGAVDVAVDPKDPTRVYATMWDHIRYPDTRVYTGKGSGVWRSTDRAASWKQLGVTNGLPPDNEANGRIGIAIDPSDPQHLYAVYANEPSGAFEAFFVSNDGGDTWIAPPGAQATLADSQSVYGWWFARLWVDPNDGDHLFLAGLDLYSSKDGGQTFDVDTSIHPDQHALAWDPKVKDRVYLGNDGGFYRSDKAGEPETWEHGKVQPFSQFINVDVSEQDPARMNGGLQDNGSNRTWGGDRWNQYFGGDGNRNLINPEDKDNVFACYQYGACARSDDGGETMDEFDQLTVSDRHNYFNPMEFDPNDPDVVFYAGDIVNKSTDRGESWTPISPDLGKQDPGREINPLYAAHYGTVTTMAVAKTDSKTIWAGTDNGYLWKTTDGGSLTSWEQVESSTLPKQWVSHIAIDPRNANVVYLTYSGYRAGDERSYVYRTRDGGKTWANISANLPQAPVNHIQPVGDRVYVATDVGVFTSSTGRVRWFAFGRDLPNVPVTWLRYIPKSKRLYAATFGRSVWSVPLG